MRFVQVRDGPMGRQRLAAVAGVSQKGSGPEIAHPGEMGGPFLRRDDTEKDRSKKPVSPDFVVKAVHDAGDKVLVKPFRHGCAFRSEEHTSELQSLMRISYAVFCLKKKNTKENHNTNILNQ